MKKEVVVVGSLNLDLVARVPRIAAAGETMTGTDFQRFAGGKGANQAVAAAMLGAPVAMIGRHGTDDFFDFVLRTLRERGVDTDAVTSADGASGVAVILVTPDGQNSIVVFPGANARLCPADVEAQAERIAGAAIVLAQLETPLAALKSTLAVAARNGVPVMLDPAPVQPLDRTVLERVEWLTPNETEAAHLAGCAVPGDAGLREFAEQLLGLGPRNVVLKLGARGAYLATAAGERLLVPAIPVTTVDSTAAGDAFNGAFATALYEGADAVEATRFGIAVASFSVTRPGAIASLPTRAEADAFRVSHAGGPSA